MDYDDYVHMLKMVCFTYLDDQLGHAESLLA